ncbi:MAG: CidA/LrgA family protein [Janthinobacterium lividum]
MLATFAILLIFQCIGEGIIFITHLPVPGPVIGMLLLFGALLVFPGLLDIIEATGTELLRHLSLLFIPAGVGIVVSASSISGQWPAIVISVICSTVLTLAVTALVTRALMKHLPGPAPLTEAASAGSDDHA